MSWTTTGYDGISWHAATYMCQDIWWDIWPMWWDFHRHLMSSDSKVRHWWFCSSRTSLRDSSVEARYVAFDVFLPSTRNWNKSKSASVSRKLMFALMFVHQLWGLGFASKLGMPAIYIYIPVSCCPQSSKETKAMSLAAHLLCSWCWSRPSPIRLLHTWVFKRFPTSTTTVTSSHNISQHLTMENR